MKLQLILLIWVSLTQAAYVSRMMVNRLRPAASSFRPGVNGMMLERPWPHRMGQANTHRPYIVYRQHNPQNRYAVKQFSGSRNVYSSPWRASRPVSSTEREFIRASALSHNGGTGIHTIPAPNLSLKEKPIVVVDAASTSEKPKFFEVTEKYQDSSVFHMAKIEQPIGFSKTTALPSQDLQSLVQNGASFQLSLGAPDLGISSLSVPQPSQFHHNLQQPPQFQHNLLQPTQFQHNLQQPTHFQQNLLQPTQFQQNFQPAHFQHNLQPAQFHQQLSQQSVVQPIAQQNTLLPQQFSLPRINPITTQPEMVQARPEGIVISPSALYQPDPAFLQKLQNQLLQRFPGIEFVPYVAEFTALPSNGGQKEKPVKSQTQGQLQAQESQIQVQTVAPEMQPQTQTSQPQVKPPQTQPSQDQTQISQDQSQPQTEGAVTQPIFLLQNEQITKQTPTSFALNEIQKNVVQRDVPEATVTLIAITSPVNNITENLVEVTTAAQPQNFTSEQKTAEPVQGTTTIKYVTDSSTADPKTTPIYYAQIGQSVGNVIANGFYSALNDIRAAALQQDTPQNMTKPQENSTNNVNTSTINPDLQPYFVQRNIEKDSQNTSANEIQPLLGAPFKPQDSTVAYTLVRADDKENKISKDGSIYAGQLVEASVSEDQDFNNAKTTFPSRSRAPIRLVARTDSKESVANNTSPKDVVKARIPPRSKLTFDDKTGEPVLRIYASYVNSPSQKDMLTSKLQSSKRVREAIYRKQDPVAAADRAHDVDGNQITQFGLKLRSRSDDYMPLFDDYQD